jgi:SAM-dependent methyltransferase
MSGTGLRRAIRPTLVRVYKPARSDILPGPGRYLLSTPVVFEFWYRLRALRFLLGHKLRAQESVGVLEKVADYNRHKMWEFYRPRTERLMSILRCVSAIPSDARVLCIGPRNEAELLLMAVYGFRLKNITGVDLFSYSPQIQCMDMHNLEFADGTFDVGYSAWTLTYSPDVRRACKELARVVKPGGVIAVGMDLYGGANEFVGEHPLPHGLADLEEAFAPYVDWIYWQEAADVANEDGKHVTFIFRRGKG